MISCGAERDLFHYVACGLANVWLADGFSERESCEGKVFHIEKVKELHQAIGLSLVQQVAVLTPDEFRFLRTEMKLSRKNLGEMFNISGETIKKWESGENPIPKTSDACLRDLYLHHIKNKTVRSLISNINSLEKQRNKICLSKTTQGWQAQA